MSSNSIIFYQSFGFTLLQQNPNGWKKEDVEGQGFIVNLKTDDASNLAGSLACQLSCRASANASKPVSPETFLIAVEMAQGQRYSFVVPYLAFAYHILAQFQYKFGEVSRTYGPWSLVRMAGAVFFLGPQQICTVDPFDLAFIPCIATFSK